MFISYLRPLLQDWGKIFSKWLVIQISMAGEKFDDRNSMVISKKVMNRCLRLHEKV